MENNSDIRVWSYIIFIAMYFLFQFPAPTLITIAVLFVVYLLFRLLPLPNRDAFSGYRNYNARMAALATAGIFLAPYDNIWRNLRLSNKFCSLRLRHDGITIVGQELSSAPNYRGRSFKIVKSKKYTMQEVWDMYCLNFDFLTNYDALVGLAKSFEVSIIENTSKTTIDTTISTSKNKKSQKTSIKSKDKLDINNASEIEITALPGISIVMAKRIIKKREEIRGFKSLDDLFLFLKLKPHMQEQLRDLVCVKKMKGSLSVERFKERNIDL